MDKWNHPGTRCHCARSHLVELFSMLVQSRQLEILIDFLRTKQPRAAIEQSIKDLKPGLVKNRCDRIMHMVDQAGVQVTEAAAAVSDADRGNG